MHIKSILLFEDENVDNLYPFSVMHNAWEVRCGALRIFEKYKHYFPLARIIYNGRKKHLNSFIARFDISNQNIERENLLVINSNVLPAFEMFKEIELEYKKLNKDISVIFTHKDIPFAMFLPANEQINPNNLDIEFLPAMMSALNAPFTKIEIENLKRINYLWDAIEYNEQSLIEDSDFYHNKTDLTAYKKKGVWLIDKENIYIGNHCKIAPNVVLDASDGNIVIDDYVKIMPNTTIIGPCFIGKNTTLKIGAKIYEKTSIGEFCKIGGEVENSIIQSYSNKQHEGFLGHSYLSEWVNIGADTNTSDLKNTYSNISVKMHNRKIDTGRMFLGLLCGDHTKSCINAMFTGGTIAGICSNLYSEWFMPNYLHSFTWGGDDKSTVFNIEKAIDIARRVMKRRSKLLLPEEIILMQDEFLKVKVI